MSSKNQFMLWVGAAVVACGALITLLQSERKTMASTWTTFLVGDPRIGAQLFFGSKNCSHCHSVDGSGGKLASDLGFVETPTQDISALVMAMWNHAPQMWARMRSENIAYPDLNYEETANLFAFLYTTRYLDEPGDAAKGRELFASKQCVRCHSVRAEDGTIGPGFSRTRSVDTPLRWAEALWNHAPVMAKQTEKTGIPWPHFSGRDANDILAYVREATHAPRNERELLPADPGRGQRVFESKSCSLCHAVNGKGGTIGPSLGPERRLPHTVVQFAGLMWNHVPQMLQRWQEHGIRPPQLSGQDISDLVAFLGVFEPNGSPAAGRTRFEELSCARCHGAAATGTRFAPALRGRGVALSSLALATALWQHGPKMYDRAQQMRMPWPKVADNDVGNLVAFLNSSVERRN